MSESEPSITTPWRRDPSALEAGLQTWARAFRGSTAVVRDLRLPGSGMANDTILFTLDAERLVARLAPAPDSHFPTFPAFDLGFQRRVMELVRARTKLPVPEIVHLEESTEFLGAPFLVVRAVEGDVADDNPPYLMDADGWFLRGTADDWQRMESATIGLFAQLHRIADDGEHTAFLHVDAPGDTALARLLASHRAYYEWARDGLDIPVLERAYHALVESLPPNDAAVVLWGDGRPGNIIYRDFEPVATLDWEMAGIGPAECDVAWTTFFQRFFTYFADALGTTTVPAMFGRARAAELYEQMSGVTLDDLAWYEALAGYRFGIILARMSLRSVAYGQQPQPADADALVVFAPLLERLVAEL